jgi:hypothetical protein
MAQASSCLAWGVLGFGGSSTAANGYTDITYYHNMDAIGNAQRASVSTTVTYNGSPTAENTTPDLADIGLGSYHEYTSSRYAQIDITNFDFDSGRLGFWWYFNSDTEDQYIFDTNASNNLRLIKTTGSGNQNFNLWYKTVQSQYVASPVTVSPGNWYFLELKFTSGTTVNLYVNGTVSTVTLSGASTAMTATTFAFPRINDSFTRYLRYDQLMYSTDNTRDLYALRNYTSF